MQWTPENLESATRVVKQLLTGLELEGYQFSLELNPRGCEVHVEYAAEDGWKGATLTASDAELLSSGHDEQVQATLLERWHRALHHPKRALDQGDALAAEAVALGRAWAEDKARQLALALAPEDWPDFWSEAENGTLPQDLPLAARRKLEREATNAARERWLELVAEARSEAVLEEETHESEASGRELEEAVARAGLINTD